MENIEKIKLKGIEYGVGDNIKVADLEVIVDSENDMVEFTFENCPAIDFFKGVKIEITTIDGKEMWFMDIVKDVDYVDGLPKHVTFTPALSFNGEVNTAHYWEKQSVLRSLGIYYAPDDKNFWFFRFASDIALEQLSAKIYYHEANETTQIIQWEL